MKNLESNLEKILQPDYSCQNQSLQEGTTLTGISPIDGSEQGILGSNVSPEPNPGPNYNKDDFLGANLQVGSETGIPIEELIGEPGGQSTPVPSPERPKVSEVDSGVKSTETKPMKVSRFDVKKVSEEKEVSDPEVHHTLPPISGLIYLDIFGQNY